MHSWWAENLRVSQGRPCILTSGTSPVTSTLWVWCYSLSPRNILHAQLPSSPAILPKTTSFHCSLFLLHRNWWESYIWLGPTLEEKYLQAEMFQIKMFLIKEGKSAKAVMVFEGMNQSAKCLPDKHEDVSVDLQHPCKKLGVVEYTCTPRTWEGQNRWTLTQPISELQLQWEILAKKHQCGKQ